MSASAAASFSGDFEEPRWHAPLHIEPYLSGANPAGTVKGMFFTCVNDLAREKSGSAPGRETYTRFKSYPLREWLEMLPECARLAYPRLSIHSALFETGFHIYRTFSESTVGRVVMSVAGRDVHAAIRLTARAYAAVASSSSVTVVEHEARRAVFELRNFWEYPDCYQAGVLAAGVQSYGEKPRVRVRSISRCDCDVELTW